MKYGDPKISEKVYIGPFCIIGLNVELEDGVIVDAYSKIDPGAYVGSNTLVIYRASIGSRAKIGKDCIIGGTVTEETEIGNRCRSFGLLIHSHTDSTQPWDYLESPEPSPRVLDDTFIAHGALVIGPVTIGPRSYVCAGAVVTKDIPPRHIAFGANRIVRYDQWKGPLSENPLFTESD